MLKLLPRLSLYHYDTQVLSLMLIYHLNNLIKNSSFNSEYMKGEVKERVLVFKSFLCSR